MIRIRTGSRLHLGLFALPSAIASAWLNCEGQPTLPRRNFGGVGLMVAKPGIELTIESATEWSAAGMLTERALSFARTYCNAVGIKEAFRLTVHSSAPEHAGLGTGTQLGLAVANAIAELTQQPKHDAATLAAMVSRGKRSALGIHGFARGGFLIEGGKTQDNAVSPLILQQPFPEDWAILLIAPRGIQGVHGSLEAKAFAGLANEGRGDAETDTLCRLVLLGMLPALQAHDLVAFGEAVYDFNRRVGAMFRTIQGGVYSHPQVAELIVKLRGAGVKGVGQSSWGPTVFAIATVDQASNLKNQLEREYDVVLTAACNQGAVLSTEY